MYCSEYGLSRPPFEPGTDPSWYFPTPAHDDAIASLHYTISLHKGACLLTGPPGVGKSLVLRVALTAVRSTAISVCVATPDLQPIDPFRSLCRTLGVAAPERDSASAVLAELRKAAQAHRQAGRSVVLAIENAHHCRPTTLAMLAAMLALESDDGPGSLIQVLLAGDDELRGALAQPTSATLRQQLFRAAQLKPFSPEQTAGYVHHRLKVAGAQRTDLFGGAALSAIHQLTGGIPRLINQLCENALISSYADSHPSVKASTLRKAAEEVLLLGDCDGADDAPARRLATDSPAETGAAESTAEPERTTEARSAARDRATHEAETIRARLEELHMQCAPLLELKERGLAEVAEKTEHLRRVSQSLRKTFRQMVWAMRQAKQQIETIEDATARNEQTIRQLGELRQWVDGALTAVRAVDGLGVAPGGNGATSPRTITTGETGLLTERRTKARLALERCSRVLEMLRASPDLFDRAQGPRPDRTPPRRSSPMHSPLSSGEVDHFAALIDEARENLDIRMMPAKT